MRTLQNLIEGGCDIFSLYGGAKYFKFLSQMAVFLLFLKGYDALKFWSDLKYFKTLKPDVGVA